MDKSNNYFEHKYKENRYKNLSFSEISSEIYYFLDMQVTLAHFPKVKIKFDNFSDILLTFLGFADVKLKFHNFINIVMKLVSFLIKLLKFVKVCQSSKFRNLATCEWLERKLKGINKNKRVKRVKTLQSWLSI